MRCLSKGKDAGCQGWQSEFDPQGPHDGKGEPMPTSYPLMAGPMPCCSPCAQAHTNKWINVMNELRWMPSPVGREGSCEGVKSEWQRHSCVKDQETSGPWKNYKAPSPGWGSEGQQSHLLVHAQMLQKNVHHSLLPWVLIAWRLPPIETAPTEIS